MANVTLSCRLNPMKRIQSDGLVRTEMNIHQPWSNVRSEYRRRLKVRVVTARGRYQGGILQRKDGTPYLCCDLKSEAGVKISLTRLMKDVGIEPKDLIDVEIVGEEWVFPDRRGSPTG